MWFRRPESKIGTQDQDVIKKYCDVHSLCPLYFEYEVVVAVAIERLDSLSRVFSATVAHKCKTLKEYYVIFITADCMGLAI
jgi:hypothetical protein